MSKVNLGRVKGDPGTAATIKIGTTTTLEPGSQATVNNSGNENAAVFNFGIPKGEEGKAASIMIDSVQTLQPEENATVENVGTTSDARLKFGIPRGKDGMTDLTAEYTDDSSYTCHPTVNAPVVVKELDGKTEQVETTGAQLFDMENYDFKTSRCTISKSSDYIIFTATAADAYFGNAIGQGMVIDQGLLPVSPNTEYTVTISNNYFTKNYISFLDSNKTGIQDYLNFTSQSQSFTTPDNCAYILLRFGNEFSANGDTERLQIMLNEGSTALPWEPYTGGQPAPSPDYPQVIKGVGGMGYFDGEWVQGNISSTGTIGTETTGITSVNAIPCKQNDNIVVTYEDSIDVIAVAFYNASGVYISTSTSGNSVDTFTATAPANAASFKVNLRVVSGSTITPNGAKYCTVTINGKYQSGVKVTGKNLAEVTLAPGTYTGSGVTMNLRPDGSYTLNGTAPNASIFRLNQPQSDDVDSFPTICILKQGKKYRLSCCQLSLRNASKPNGATSTVNAMNNDVIYIPTEDTEIIGIRVLLESGKTYNSSKVYYPGIWEDESETDTEWQPFKRTSLSIPLTSPLYEGDKICYVKPGDKYVNADGDTVVADGVLYGCYRENATVVFDGSEDENWFIFAGSFQNVQRFACDTEYTYNNNVSNHFCDKLKYEIEDGDYDHFRLSGSATRINQFVVFINKDIANDVETFRTWLQSHNLIFVSELATPYFEPFVDQSIFYALRTDDTLSYVYSSDPIEPVLTVEVAKNSTGGYLLESYAQAQKNAISEANSQSRISAIEQQLVNQATTPTE